MSKGGSYVHRMRPLVVGNIPDWSRLQMRSALYYPHTEIKSENLLKTALLLWDRLEFIVPWHNYKPTYADAKFSEAIELIGSNRYPSDSEKRQAHEIIEDFATRKLPEPFYYRTTSRSHEDYEVYPQKLAYETWQMLEQLQLAGDPLANSDYPLSQAAGLSIMSLLADCCAGETRSRITDRQLAYATVTNLLVSEKPAHEGDHDVVVPLTLELVNVSELTLSQLINFRKNEGKSGGHDLRDLRHRYLSRIEAHILAIRTAKRASDRRELQRQFQDDMRDDLAALKAELRVARQDAWLSKDVMVTAIATAAVATGWASGLPFEVPAALTLAGAPITIGGTISTRNKFATSRRSIMQKHPMAYLYEITK